MVSITLSPALQGVAHTAMELFARVLALARISSAIALKATMGLLVKTHSAQMAAHCMESA
jgi:hypothetical protein